MRRMQAWVVVAVAAGAACGGGGSKGPTGPGGGADNAPVPSHMEPVPPEPEVAPPAVAQGKPKDDLIPRKVLFGNPERAGVQISPDGKRLAWLAPRDGVLNVFVAPVGDLAKAKPVTAETARPIRTYFWAYDNAHVLYMQDKAGDENFHLLSVDLATDKTTDLTPIEGVRAEVYALSHRKPTLAIIGLNDRDPKFHDAYQVDLATGDKKKLIDNTQGFVGYDVDDQLVIRFASKLDDAGTLTMFAPDKKGAWTEYDKVAPEDLDTFGIHGFDKKGKTAYVTDPRGRDTAALFAMDLTTKKKKLLYEDPRSDVAAVLIHPTENTVQAAGINWDRNRWTALDKRVKADLDGMAKLSEGDCVKVSGSLDDKTWIVGCNGDRQPTRFFVWDRKKQQGTFLFSAQPALDDLPLARMHPFVIKSRDGLDLVSYLSLPNAVDPDGDGKPSQPVATVLLVHGGPWSRDLWGYNPLHQMLANRGYAVLSVNFRASSGFGKKFLNAGNFQWGKKMHDDLLDAVEWAVSSGVSPRDQICIMGGSYGGYATLVGVTMTPDVFACGVDIVGISNIMTWIAAFPPYWLPALGIVKARVGDHASDQGKQALLAVSPLTHAAQIKKPLLIGQGANDPRVKQAESEQIVKAMQAKKIPVSYVLFPDEGHGFARPENRLAFFAIAEAFLSAHLGGFYQPMTKADFQGSTVEIKAGREGIPGLPPDL